MTKSSVDHKPRKRDSLQGKERTRNNPELVKMDSGKEIYKLVPIDEMEGYQFQEMFELNKTYAGYYKDMRIHEFALRRIDDEIKAFDSGEWKPPLMIQLTKNRWRNEFNKDKIIERLNEEKKTIVAGTDNLRCQMEQKHDEFVECIIRCRNILNGRIGKKEIKDIVGQRNIGKMQGKKELSLLDKEFNAVTAEKLIKEVKEKQKG